MKKLIILFALLTGCVDYDDDRLRTLEYSGYSQAILGDFAWLGCGKNESGRYFTATAPNGKSRVQGVVCCGWPKSCTVRF